MRLEDLLRRQLTLLLPKIIHAEFQRLAGILAPLLPVMQQTREEALLHS